ncbi:MAG: 16S rRNA (guanine(966)-N(2))-methyltransferase RsmD [Anaerolineae bacterium]|jgi:16S rRNA (guanine(966)-N(2))-methyltransferase RsmD|nr:16S rRNA (guanine(966)-N(2))-methyltransferase RsmD [Anaerolineae bacterium]
MRVIAGKAKSRKLRSVPGPGTRPITDRAKSALFSILGEDVQGAAFLDLFAGTGQVGIEALSRGAVRAIFVEQGEAALRTIHQNLTLTGLQTGADVRKADVFQYLNRPTSEFDFIYVAPPQYRGLWKQTLTLLDRQMEWLAEDGWIIVQIHPVEFEALSLEHLTLFDQRQYGSVMLCFYARPVA